MRAKKQNRPKRRSFYEPESKKLIDWLNAQHDLGTSLQLIIVDAIQKYGDGDVIKAYLKTREAHVTRESRDAKSVPVKEIKPNKVEYRLQSVKQEGNAKQESKIVPAKENKASDTSDAARKAPKKESKANTPESDYDPIEALTRDAEAGFLESREDVRTAKQPARPASEIESPLASDEYDPLAVMFEDIGSRFDR